MVTDSQLLRQYVDSHDESAFAEVVDRHMALIYATALRLLDGDTYLAQDVTQTVFSDLARKAPMLRDRPTVAGWLHTSARFLAMKTVRTEQRRRVREQEATTMTDLNSTLDVSWEQLRPLLDDAVGHLGEADRDALLLRYFEGKSHREVAAALNLDEDAARMRVERALDKLRGHFARSGVTTTAAALATTLGAYGAVPVPAALSASLAGTAIASGQSGVVSTVLQVLFGKASVVQAVAAVAVVASIVTLVVVSGQSAGNGANTSTANSASSSGAGNKQTSTVTATVSVPSSASNAPVVAPQAAVNGMKASNPVPVQAIVSTPPAPPSLPAQLDGIAVVIQPQKNTFAGDEPLVIDITFQNLSKQALRLPQRVGPPPRVPVSNWELKLENVNTGKIYTGSFSAMSERSGTTNRTQPSDPIAAGGTVATTANFTTFAFTENTSGQNGSSSASNTSAATFTVPAGTYKVSVNVRFPLEVIGADKLPVWGHDAILSNPAQITILPAKKTARFTPR